MLESGTARFSDPRLSLDVRVADLLDRLTPEEKVGQLTARQLPADGPPDESWLSPAPGFLVAPAGRVEDVAARVRTAQAQLSDSGPWGIPALVVTLRDFAGAVRFPGPLACAAAWDQVLVEHIAAASAAEGRAGGATVRLGPVLATAIGPHPAATADRDHCLGGDPVLTAELVAAHVRGAQGPVPGRIRPGGGAVLLTQLGAVAAQLAGAPANAHERTMRSSVLLPAEAAVAAGALLLIPTPAANAGVPGHADSWLLRDVLRREWGFDGVVMAAGGAVGELVGEHRVADDLDTAFALALEAGVDVVGVDTVGPPPAARLLRLLREGALPSWLLDDAVSSVLRLKMALGLFEDAGPIEPRDRTGGPAHRALARRAGVESLVLIADTGDVLPLAGADAIDVICADPVARSLTETGLLAGALGAAMPGCDVRDRGGSSAGDPDLARTVVAVVSGDPRAASTAVSRLVATGRRCVVLVCSGDVDGAPALASTRAAVLLCWRPVAEDPAALADVLSGISEPGGRLPLQLGGSSRFPLGHGRGYTNFEYSQLQVLPGHSTGAEPVVAQFRLTNTGTRAGKEVAQVYLHDHVSSVRRPSRILAGFAAVRLEPGTSRRVRIPLSRAQLAVWDRTMRRTVEPGVFDVLVGHSATDIRLSGTFSAGSGHQCVTGQARRA